MGLKKPHRQTREFDNMLTDGMKVERDWWSKVLLYTEMKEALCPNLFQDFLQHINRGGRNNESEKIIPILTTVTEKADLLLRRWLLTWSNS